MSDEIVIPTEWYSWSGDSLGHFVLPINIKVESRREAEHICNAHNRIVRQHAKEIEQLLRIVESAQRAFNACMNGEIANPITAKGTPMSKHDTILAKLNELEGKVYVTPRPLIAALRRALKELEPLWPELRRDLEKILGCKPQEETIAHMSGVEIKHGKIVHQPEEKK